MESIKFKHVVGGLYSAVTVTFIFNRVLRGLSWQHQIEEEAEVALEAESEHIVQACIGSCKRKWDCIWLGQRQRTKGGLERKTQSMKRCYCVGRNHHTTLL